MKTLKFAILFGLTVLIQFSLMAQEWVSYQSQQNINDLVETSEELVLATDAGLVKVNKTTLEKTIINKANSNLTNNHIQTITKFNGNTWIGTYDAVISRLDGSEFKDMTTPESEFYDQYTLLYDFKIAPNGDFWLGTSDGVFHRAGETWFHYDQDDLGELFFKAWDIEIKDNGEVFIGSANIHKFAEGEWSNLSESTEIFAYLDCDLFFSNSGDLYMTGDLDKIGRFDGEQWYEYDLDSEINGSQVLRFTEDQEGNVYFNTQYNGVYKIEENSISKVENTQTETANDHISYFYIDEQNNQWINSTIHLSTNINGSIQSTLISDHTLGYNNTYGMSKGENGKMYFITADNENMAVVDTDGQWSVLPLPNPNPSFVYSPFVIDDNEIWLPTSEGTYRYNGSEWTNEIPAGSSLTMDSQGKIYVKKSGGISIINNGEVAEYNIDNSPLYGEFVSSHGIDADDNLWISEGSYEQDFVFVIHKVSPDGTWTSFTSDEHPSIRRTTGNFHFDKDGNVWVSDDIAGVIKFDGNNWSNPFFGNFDSIEETSVFAIESDEDGKMFFSHQYGVTSLQDEVWENLLIEDVPNNFSSHSSIIKFDDAGNLWWASNRYGVFAYTKEMEMEPETSTLSPIAMSQNMTISPNPAENHTVINFTINETAKVQVSIYNQIGQLQSSLDLGEISGRFQQKLDVANLPIGLYTIQLQINNQFTTKKLMIH